MLLVVTTGGRNLALNAWVFAFVLCILAASSVVMHSLPMEFSAGVVALLGWFGFAGLVTSRGPMNSSRCKFWVWCVLAFACIGEAANPGPGVQWKVGIANLTGLTKKLDQVAQLDGDTWIFSETHIDSKSPFVNVRPFK